jgi:Domain of unknown function (DUF4440)
MRASSSVPARIPSAGCCATLDAAAVGGPGAGGGVRDEVGDQAAGSALDEGVPDRAATVLVAVILLQVTGHPLSSLSSADSAATVTNLQETERMRLQALVDADMRVVNRLHATDFQLIPPPGTRLSRAEFHAGVAAGNLDFLAFEPISPIEVRVQDKAAVLWYRSRIDIVATGEGRYTHDSWHTCVYEIQDGRWQIVWEQDTAVGGVPSPAPS